MIKKVEIEALNPLHGNVNYLSEIRELARKNRHNPTTAESKIWNEVLRYQKSGFKFTRQKPIFRFILDFYCSKLNLAVEIDGSSHDVKRGYDWTRDRYLYQIGINTIRFTNEEVLKRIDMVKEKLLKFFEASPVKGRCRRRRG